MLPFTEHFFAFPEPDAAYPEFFSAAHKFCMQILHAPATLPIFPRIILKVNAYLKRFLLDYFGFLW